MSVSHTIYGMSDSQQPRSYTTYQKEKLRYGQSWKDFLEDKYPRMDLFGTLTFTQDYSEDYALSIFKSFWVKAVRGWRQHITLVYCWDEQPKSGRIHLHFVAIYEESPQSEQEIKLRAKAIEHLWKQDRRRGDCKVEKYNRDMGGAIYNHMNHENWWIDTYCPTNKQKNRARCKKRCCYWGTKDNNLLMTYETSQIPRINSQS